MQPNNYDDNRFGDISLELILQAAMQSAQRQPSVLERITDAELLRRLAQAQAQSNSIQDQLLSELIRQQRLNLALQLHSAALNPFAPLLPLEADRIQPSMHASTRQQLPVGPLIWQVASPGNYASFNSLPVQLTQQRPDQLPSMTSFMRQPQTAHAWSSLSGNSSVPHLLDSNVQDNLEKTVPVHSTATRDAGMSSEGIGSLFVSRPRRRRPKRPRRQQSLPVEAALPSQGLNRQESSQAKSLHPSFDAPEKSGAIAAANLPSPKRRPYKADPFPVKLLRMIETAKEQGLEHLISFTENGTAVRMSSPNDLEELLFPKFFVSCRVMG